MPKIQRSPRSRFATTAWWLTAVLVFARVIPVAARPGMFFDGVIYATIARNLAAGEGDFWHLHWLSETTSDWHDSPPLALWLESLLFRVAGDHFWIEKVYSVLTCFATALLIAAIWRSLVDRRSALIEYDWLPVALWACVPSVALMYSSNMLENTLGVFAAASVYFSLRAMAAERWSLAWIAAAALGLLAAVLSKGPTGLFPLATPLIAGLTVQREKWLKSLAMTAALATGFVLAFGLLLLQPAAREYVPAYFRQQVVASLSGHREIVTSPLKHFYLLSHIAHQMTWPTAIAAGLVVLVNRGRIASLLGARFSTSRSDDVGASRSSFSLMPVVAFSLLTAASASLPIMISPKQWGHYAIPSFPYFAIALAGWCVPAVAAMVRGIPPVELRRQWLLRPLATVAIVVVGVVIADRPQRQIGVYRDMLSLRQLVPRHTVIGIGTEMATDHWLECNMLRWSDVRFEEGAANYEYRVTLNGNALPPDGYALVAADLQCYRLYRRTESPAVAERLPTARPRD